MKCYFAALTPSSCSFLKKKKKNNRVKRVTAYHKLYLSLSFSSASALKYTILLICFSVSVNPSEILQKKCQKQTQRTNPPPPSSTLLTSRYLSPYSVTFI